MMGHRGGDCGWTRLRLDAALREVEAGRFHFALSLARIMAYIVVASLLPEPLEPLPSWLSDFPEPPYC